MFKTGYAVIAMSCVLATGALALPSSQLIEIDSSQSFIEGCDPATLGCRQLPVSGQLRFNADLSTAEASLEYLDGFGVSVPAIILPNSQLERALNLLADAERFPGVLTAAAGLFDLWLFDGISSGENLSLGVRIFTGASSSPFSFSGGTMPKPVDDLSFRINLVGVVVPEPTSGILMGVGLVGLATRRRRSRALVSQPTVPPIRASPALRARYPQGPTFHQPGDKHEYSGPLPGLRRRLRGELRRRRLVSHRAVLHRRRRV